MEILSNLIDGFSALLGTATIPWWEPMLVIIIGTSVGILIGVLPGLSASTGLALIVPFTFGMDPLIAIILIATVYGACSYGGSITAIAINTPGTPAAVAVAFDGYYLTKNGQPGRALGASLFANSLGGIIGALVLIFFAVPLAKGALYFGPPAFFSLAIFGLTIVSSMESGNRLKGFISTAAGLLLMTVGLDIINAHPRFTFGRTELFDGFSFIPALIGLFALGEVLLNIEKMKSVRSAVKTFSGKIPAFSELWAIKKNVIKSGALGALIGAIPGAGATIAAFVAYGESKRVSKKPEDFGKGSLEGLTAPSAAAGASDGGALIPLLTLGIPGSAATAVMIGALTLHNITPGPELFKPENSQLVYALFASVFMYNIVMMGIGLLGNKLWVRLISAPKTILYPVIIGVAFVGSYAVNNSMFDVYVCLGFGILGWVMRRHGFPTAPMVLAMILGRMAENNIRQALLANEWTIFFTNPLSLVLLLFAVISLVYPLIQERRKRKSIKR